MPVTATKRKVIEIDGRATIHSVTFLSDGKHILSGGQERRIRQWLAENGGEVGKPKDMEGFANDLRVSQDGKWIVGGSSRGDVLIWDAQSHEQVNKFKGHTRGVSAVDISPDGTTIASGSFDRVAYIRSRSTGERLLTLRHDYRVAAVKFSPDGVFLATATWKYQSIRVYKSLDGALLAEFPIQVPSNINQSIAWRHDNKSLFALSAERNIYHLDVFSGATLAKWPIQTSNLSTHGCISLVGNSTLIAVSTDTSLAFWDTVTQEKIVSHDEYPDIIWSIAISENNAIAIAHGKTITLRNLQDILPFPYISNVSHPVSRIQLAGFAPESEPLCPLQQIVLHNELAKLQVYSDAQSRELSSAREELALVQRELKTLKSSNTEKELTIHTLTTQVDHWMHSYAAKAEELAVAHKELEERRRDSEELISVREELRFSRSEVIRIRQWYEEQLTQLKSIVEDSQHTLFSVQSFITKSDALAENAIIEMLERLNDNVLRSSVFMAERVLHNFQPFGADPTEEQTSAMRRVTECIGQPLLNRIRSNSRADAAEYLPMAFRAYLIYYLRDIISPWSVDNGSNQLIRETYKRIWELESQTVSARWRSLTFTCTSHTCVSNPHTFITTLLKGLSDIIVVAGCATSTSAANTLLSTKLYYWITFIIATAGQLTKSMMDAVSADYNVETARPTTTFDGTTMEVDSSRRAPEKLWTVLGTTQLGLSKEVVTQEKVRGKKKNTVAVTTVIKPKVLPG